MYVLGQNLGILSRSLDPIIVRRDFDAVGGCIGSVSGLMTPVETGHLQAQRIHPARHVSANSGSVESTNSAKRSSIRLTSACTRLWTTRRAT